MLSAVLIVFLHLFVPLERLWRLFDTRSEVCLRHHVSLYYYNFSVSPGCCRFIAIDDWCALPSLLVIHLVMCIQHIPWTEWGSGSLRQMNWVNPSQWTWPSDRPTDRLSHSAVQYFRSGTLSVLESVCLWNSLLAAFPHENFFYWHGQHWPAWYSADQCASFWFWIIITSLGGLSQRAAVSCGSVDARENGAWAKSESLSVLSHCWKPQSRHRRRAGWDFNAGCGNHRQSFHSGTHSQ